MRVVELRRDQLKPVPAPVRGGKGTVISIVNGLKCPVTEPGAFVIIKPIAYLNTFSKLE